MKIYTKGGDRGETGLFGGGRVRKDDARVEAYGAVDELNAVLGIVRALLGTDPGEVASVLGEVQADLFALGALLATPAAAEGGRAEDRVRPLPPERIGALEEAIDRLEERLPALRSFILPGGSPAGAHLHLARTVCRRAERRTVTLAAGAQVDGAVVAYLNRLSDLLFVAARVVNREAGAEEVEWHQGPG